MFGHVDSLSAARLLPSPVRCWARVRCKDLLVECKAWHDSQTLYAFFYLVFYNFWTLWSSVVGTTSFRQPITIKKTAEKRTLMVVSSLNWMLTTTGTFIIGEKKQLRWWYLRNSGP